MMIGKPEWFKRRKYGGWGISPRTWQGWAYIAAVILPFVIFHALPFWETQTRIIITALWVAFLMVDVNHIMLALKRDEREYRIEAIAERNAGWFMVLVLVAGILYQIISSAMQQTFEVNWFMVTALFGGAIIKSVSNIYMDKKGLH
ncbi:MAG: hypothetical protein R6U32_00165 [Candidatus Woesearchaeota archaeon]